MTIKFESHFFPLQPFIMIVLDSFNFDQMKPLNIVQFDCSLLFF